MIRVWLVLLLMALPNLLISSAAVGLDNSTVPESLNIGVLYSFNTSVGRMVKIAVETAVNDINSDSSILGKTKLKLSLQEDSKYRGFLSIAEALQLMATHTVAIIGPQTSTTAHVISHIANELHVPLLSFTATDPTLSSLQFPFFIRTAFNDIFQMTAIADMVSHYGWREVIVVYGDDDHGRNGIGALADKLAERRCKISFKAPMTPDAKREEITDVLVQVALAESRVIVLHTSTSWGPKVLSVAKSLGMMQNGYVWIATTFLTSYIDIDSPLSSDEMDNIQGVITLRMYIPDSKLKRSFVSRWTNLTRGKEGNGPLGLSTYGIFAYDTVYVLARALDTFLKQGNQITFSHDPKISELRGDSLHLDAVKIFNEGNLLCKSIYAVNMTGVMGPFRYTPDGNLANPAYEIINVIGSGTRRIATHCVLAGRNNPNTSRLGFSKQWKAVKNWSTEKVNLLPYAVPYKFVPYGDGQNNPSNTELVRLITAGVFDAAVGDITITTERTKMVDFTQPYTESGLVVVASVKKTDSNAWAFLTPFTPMMWTVTAIFFLLVGAVVWILEHRLNDDFRGPPKKQVATILWFTFSTMFFAHRENTVSTLGRFVLLIWLFVVLIINSSYTASLTSILTVQQLSSPIKGIESLVNMKEPIGYLQGSFARSYLIDEIGIHESRLVPLKTPEETAKALEKGPQKGGVAAYINERAYIELFLSSRCDFTIVGQEFTKNGWGFAFPPDSPLAVDLSTAILELAENGDLQRIHDKWLLSSACRSQGAKLGVDRLNLKSFWGLYLVCGLACFLALLIYLIQTLRQYKKHSPDEVESTGQGSGSSRLRTFLSFVDEKEEIVKNRSKRRQMERISYRSTSEVGSTIVSNKDFSQPSSNRIDSEV
ncbi:unnamed protein product [Vicia faba]|uniref:Glutamate receptor n=1 Tax=Vicia faba TaxID=3906 RepID=A0AAV1AF12_VICFA|nr:unnamed protein product [Vicia faba]